VIHTNDSDPFAATRARNQLVARLREALKGRNLEIRERRHELVIACPGHPDRGRVYINLTSGEVSHSRPVWTYLGYLPGYGPDRDPGDDGEARVDTDVITTILTSPETAIGPHPDSHRQ
jgi:hypothetical protein